MEQKVIPIIPVSQLSVSSPSPKAKPLVEVKPKRIYKGNTSLGVGMYVFHKCNARCDYCFWFRDFDIKAELTEEGYKRALDEIVKRPNVHLNLLGGEPTMYKELHGLINYACDIGITDFCITTNFLRPLTWFNALPHLADISLNITIHPDIFKKKTDEEFDAFIDKIITFCTTKPGRRNRIGVVLDERYKERVVHLLERLKSLKLMKYPVLITYQTYDYYKVTQEFIDSVKPYFHEAFIKYTVNEEERDILDDAVNNGPSFEGYWCNLNTVEIFTDGRVSTTCTDKYLGNIFQTDDIVKNYKPLNRCTITLCDNFNRVLLKKWKYGKYT